MRTRLGVMGRLLAHITALALLVLMLVYVRPEEEKPPLPPAPPMSGFTAPSRPPVVPEAITPMPIPSATGESAASSGEISAPAEIKPEPDAPSGASSGSALPGFDPATIGIIESGSEGTTEPVPPISPEVVDSPVPVISAVPEPEPIPVPEPDEIPVPAEDSEPIVPAEPEQSETTGPSIPQPAVDQATHV
ncbi:MAG: hypothetical protein LIP23_00145, partial [Planctomycetes bacterium]|nr:hypothetical protein [Planctomycetota bacterium]